MEQEQTEQKTEKKGLWERMFNKNKIKGNKVAVLFLKNNGTAVPLEVESKTGIFEIEGRSYHEDSDCIYSMSRDRYPLAIIPEWSLIPYGTRTWHEKPILEKFAECQDHAIRGIRRAELVRMGDKEKSQLSTKAMVIIGIMIIIALAFVMGYK